MAGGSSLKNCMNRKNGMAVAMIRKHRKPPDFDIHFLLHLKSRNTHG